MSKMFLDEEESVLNVGLDVFSDSIGTGAEVLDLDWTPPNDVDEELLSSLTDLAKHGDQIEAANQEAFDRIVSAQPIWTDVRSAADEISALDSRTVLHSGPPVDWESMSGPQRGAVIGAIIYEGWADDPESARELAGSGAVSFEPCHEHSAVGPMAGVISPSMPIAVIENEAEGNIAYTNLNEGLGSVLRFGAYSESVIDHLEWMEAELAPVLKSAVQNNGGVDLKHISAQALQMGDEVHNRNVAGTSLLVRSLASEIADYEDHSQAARTLEFLEDNDHFFLNLSMGACKTMADAASDIRWSTVVTALSRNGTEFGIRISGLGDRWFTAPAPVVDGLYFPDYSAEDASPDIGDSSIAETMGIGGFAMAGSPAITEFVGGTPADARRYTEEMYEITVGKNPNYTLPPLDFQGTPTGIDLLKVINTGVQPIINSGIAHKEPGIGQIGAGIGRAPRACFIDAARAFSEEYLEDEHK